MINNEYQKITHDINQLVVQIIEILSTHDWHHFKLYFFIKEKFLMGDFDDKFKRVFCSFYVMNGARGLKDLQKEKFFQLLTSRESSLENILRELYAIHGYGNRKKLFLSFSTKLLHTIGGTLPIYDLNIASVLKLPPQTQIGSLEEKITNRITIYKKLQEDSKNLLEDAKIKDCLKYIRKELSNKAERENFLWQDKLISEEKLLDSVLWALYTARKTRVGAIPAVL